MKVFKNEKQKQNRDEKEAAVKRPNLENKEEHTSNENAQTEFSCENRKYLRKK